MTDDPTDGVPFIPAVHFNKGRDGRKIDMIILHWMTTNLAGCDATFTGGGRVASATYGVEDTTIHQYVKEEDGSYNAGNWDANMRSIAIEHSAGPGRDASAATIETSILICVAKCIQYSIDPDRIFPHNKFFATACPGTLPVEYIKSEVKRRLAGGAASTPSQDDDMFEEADRQMVKELLNVARTGRRDGDTKAWPYPFTPTEALLNARTNSKAIADAVTAALASQGVSKDVVDPAALADAVVKQIGSKLG